ncbi:MAG: hypothetical protein U0930_12330 [Pirellulales bacterium]
MTSQYLAAEKFVRKRLMDGIFTIVILIGGSKAVLAKLKALFPLSIFAVIDNRREVELLRQEIPSLGIVYFAMGENETSASLHVNSPQAVREAARKTGNSNMHNGYGARRENATKAADNLICSAAFIAWRDSLIDLAMVQTKGRLHSINIVVCGSSAGAGYAGAALKITDEAVRSLSYTGAQIQVQFDVLGTTTFAGIAKRGRANSSLAILSQIAYSFRNRESYELRVSKSNQLHDLLPTGINRDQREALLLLDAVAMGSVQMLDYLSVPQPNREQDDAFGATLSREVDFTQQLDRKNDLLSAVAAPYFAAIDKACKNLTRDLSAVDDIAFDESDLQEYRRESIENILANVLDEDKELRTLEAVQRPDRVARRTLRVISKSASDCVLERIPVTLSEVPADFDSYVRRIELFMGYVAVATKERVELELASSLKSSQIDRLSNQLMARIKNARRKGYALKDKKSVQLATSIRTLSDELNRLDEELDAAMRAQAVVSVELEVLNARLNAVKDLLSQHVPRDSKKHDLTLVSVCSINDFFQRLLTLSTLNETEQIDLLCSAAIQCTESGLAKIVGSSTTALDAIARQVVHGEYSIIGPSHAGQYRAEPADRVYALPPCEPLVEAALPKLIKELDSGAAVVFNDTIAFGATVCRVKFRRFHSVQSIFDGMLGHDLWVALNDPLAALNAKDGWQIVQALGGRAQGETIVFDGPVDYCAIEALDL